MPIGLRCQIATDGVALPDNALICHQYGYKPVGIEGKKCNVGRRAIGSPLILVNEVELGLSSRPKHLADIDGCGSAQDFDHEIS